MLETCLRTLGHNLRASPPTGDVWGMVRSYCACAKALSRAQADWSRDLFEDPALAPHAAAMAVAVVGIERDGRAMARCFQRLEAAYLSASPAGDERDEREMARTYRVAAEAVFVDGTAARATWMLGRLAVSPDPLSRTRGALIARQFVIAGVPGPAGGIQDACLAALEAGLVLDSPFSGDLSEAYYASPRRTTRASWARRRRG